MNTDAIQITDLTHQFDGKTALSHISTSIQKGMVTGIVGPDGAGKTTLIRLLAGLLKASSGQIRVNNLDPISEATQLRPQLGYMPQKFGLYEDLTVQENLNLYAELCDLYGEARQVRFQQLLAFTDLARFTNRPAGKLSGGMKQKLGLACTLLGSPRVLLLDEPSVGVDPISRRELWKMVSELIGDGITVIWSTSYLDEAELCDGILLMNEGKLVYKGAPQQLIARMQGRTVQLREIAGNKREVLKKVLHLPFVIDGVIQGNALRFVLRENDQASAFSDAVAYFNVGKQAQVVEVKPSLEDAFINILGGGPGGESVLANHMPPTMIDASIDQNAVIEAHQLTRVFGDFTATDRVNFQVKRGEIFGLLGPNGAGKSTTFKMMCGLLKPTSGAAKVMGIDLKKSPSQARSQIGYMAQKFALYGNLTVEQNLHFFSGIYGLSGTKQREAINDMVRVFNLEPYLPTRADTLPLGFKQRLALSCAIMHQPPVLFLDEPTSGVDPLTRREFWTHINGLVAKGVTVMVTTHFMDEAEYCDRIGLIYRGRTIAAGTPDELKKLVLLENETDTTMEETFIRLVQRDE